LRIKNPTDAESLIEADVNGAVRLYHNNVEKLATTATGIDVTGTATMDGLTVETATGTATPTPSQITIATSSAGGDWSETNPWGRLAFYSADTSAGGAKEEATLDVVAAQAAGGVSDFFVKTYNSGLKNRIKVGYEGDVSFYEDTGTTAKLFWDASAESLGIGTSSPSAALHVSASAEVVTRLSRSAGANSLVLFQDPTTTTAPYIGSYGNEMAFGRYGGGEAMRIDSAGNLLVGTTDSNVSNNTGIANSGINLLATGQILAAYGGNTANFNRLGSNGNIVNFDKDGTTVGSIGSYLDAYSYIGSTGGTDTHIAFVNGTVRPSTATGGGLDATLDLGSIGSRFKDLYLSGGVVFGATGGSVSSKTLDDYEEGTFTPVLADAITGGNTATGSTVEGHYTKVGRLVTLNMSLININTTGMTGGLDLFIRALPFTSAGGQIGRGEGSVRADRLTYSGYVTPAIESADAYLRLADNVSATSDVWLDVSAINSGNTDLFISISYNVA
jgi:hypothetical protein